MWKWIKIYDTNFWYIAKHGGILWCSVEYGGLVESNNDRCICYLANVLRIWWNLLWKIKDKAILSLFLFIYLCVQRKRRYLYVLTFMLLSIIFACS